VPTEEQEVVLEVLGSARSMRWFKEDPVDWALVEQVIWAGTRASSPNNTQGWDFVVVTEPETKRRVQEAILARSSAPPAGSRPAAEPAAPMDPTQRRTLQGARNVMTTMPDIPVLIFVCGSNTYPEGAPVLAWAYSAMYAASQNMLVAARALGLGAAFTTFHQQAEPEIRSLLGIPDDRIIGVTMPLGWPARPFGPVTRRPVAEVLHRDAW
jgi:nitroreductase